jgi:hypothetical protein
VKKQQKRTREEIESEHITDSLLILTIAQKEAIRILEEARAEIRRLAEERGLLEAPKRKRSRAAGKTRRARG